jgi:hypothetical protein
MTHLDDMRRAGTCATVAPDGGSRPADPLPHQFPHASQVPRAALQKLISARRAAHTPGSALALSSADPAAAKQPRPRSLTQPLQPVAQRPGLESRSKAKSGRQYAVGRLLNCGTENCSSSSLNAQADFALPAKVTQPASAASRKLRRLLCVDHLSGQGFQDGIRSLIHGQEITLPRQKVILYSGSHICHKPR